MSNNSNKADDAPVDPLTASPDQVEWLLDVTEPLPNIDSIPKAHELLASPSKLKDWSVMDFVPHISRIDGLEREPVQTGDDFCVKSGPVSASAHVIESSSTNDGGGAAVYDTVSQALCGWMKNRVRYDLFQQKQENDGTTLVMGRVREVKPGLAGYLTPKKQNLETMHRDNLQALNKAFQKK